MGYFVLSNNGEFSVQITGFSKELPHYSVALGFTADDVTEAVEDAAFMAWLVKSEIAQEKNKLAWTAFVNSSRNNSNGALVLVPPIAIVLDAMPKLVLPGIQGRFAQKGAKAKANGCSEAIQKILGIFTSADASQVTEPFLKLKEEAGFPEVSFQKHGYVTMNLYRDTGKGYDSKPYKTVSKSPFLDTDLPANGVAAQYKYKGIYTVNDVETGSYSAEVSINVVGK